MTKARGIGRGRSAGSKRAHFTKGPGTNPLARPKQPDYPPHGTWQEPGIGMKLSALRWVMEVPSCFDRNQHQHSARVLKRRDEAAFMKELADLEAKWAKLKEDPHLMDDTAEDRRLTDLAYGRGAWEQGKRFRAARM